MRRERGFTLIELVVSAAILAIISIYLTGMLTQQNRAYAVVDQVTETQSNTRAVASLMEREIRSTGLMAPEGAAACGVDNLDAPDILYVTDSDAYSFASETRYDLGAEISSGFTGTGNAEDLRLVAITVDSLPYYDLDGDGNGDADFRPGSGVIVLDKRNPDRGTSCGIIRPGGVDVAGRMITVDFSAAIDTLAPVPPNRPAPTLVAVPAHRYMIDANNQMLRDDLVLSDDVEDLQIAFHFDVNDDNAIDAGEEMGIDGTRYEPGEWNHENLRRLRFNFVMRSRRPDPNLNGATFQVRENRAPIAGTDGFRRRAFTAEVRPRNIGHRWHAGT